MFDRWLAGHDRDVADTERERIVALLESALPDNPFRGGIAISVALIKGGEQ